MQEHFNMPDDDPDEAVEEPDRELLKRNLFEQIEKAFGDVRLGDGISISQADGIDIDWHNDPKLRELDPEERWQEIPDEKLERLSTATTFMDPEGLRFYLPRFMIYALEHEEKSFDTWASVSAIHSADPRDTTGAHAMMSTEQMAVLQAFTDYFSNWD